MWYQLLSTAYSFQWVLVPFHCGVVSFQAQLKDLCGRGVVTRLALMGRLTISHIHVAAGFWPASDTLYLSSECTSPWSQCYVTCTLLYLRYMYLCPLFPQLRKLEMVNRACYRLPGACWDSVAYCMYMSRLGRWPWVISVPMSCGMLPFLCVGYRSSG